MAEYIEREAALDCFACDLGKKDYSVSYQGFMTESAFRINAIPAADVLPVVRCRDCEYGKEARVNEKGFLICPASGMEITDNDYCSYGARMDGDGQ